MKVTGNSSATQDWCAIYYLYFTRMGWIHALDGIGLDAFERDNTSFVDDKLRDRLGDVIWRIKLNGQTIYVYLLLEFQSSVDKYMAVRHEGHQEGRADWRSADLA